MQVVTRSYGVLLKEGQRNLINMGKPACMKSFIRVTQHGGLIMEEEGINGTVHLYVSMDNCPKYSIPSAFKKSCILYLAM